MATLFTLPIGDTGSITATNPPAPSSDPSFDTKKIYILTFTSPADNRLTPTFIDAFLLALDIIEHRYPKGVVVTTSGIPKFYSNGLDLAILQETEGFLERHLWVLFRRLLTCVSPLLRTIWVSSQECPRVVIKFKGTKNANESIDTPCPQSRS